MMTLETRVEIHVLHRQGMSIRAIARQLSCSRETVRRYIRSPLPVADMRYKPRMPTTCKLDPFKPYVLERVAAARPQWIPASVLLREIGQRGYDGGYSMLTAFLHPMKQPVTEAVTRFETEPGVQMQVDFTIVRQGHNPLLAFVATLGWSRATFVKFYSNQESAAWCDGIESALKFFGVTPHQLLFDNAKAIIIERDVYGPGKHRWNPQLMQLAEKYAFTPKVCRPYRAKTKGKVERFNHYLKNSFVVPLAATFRQAGLILDVPAANARIGEWLITVANTRKHGTTAIPPEQRMPRERAALLPLPKITLALPPPVPASCSRPIPTESLQHPLATYQALLEVEA
ncbi:IS21 family transposase [Symbiopectobacterium purcellii]|uniref:IS21 family transposase n=1 Tax=Symbiopectobacterium purcellii TaxID=2871826 RepID=UPI003F82B23E